MAFAKQFGGDVGRASHVRLVQMEEQGLGGHSNSRLLIALDIRESRYLGYLVAALTAEFGSTTSSTRKGLDSSFHGPHIWLKCF